MATPILEMGIVKKLTFLIFIICISISVKNQNAGTRKWPWNMMASSSSSSSASFSPPFPWSSGSVLLSIETEDTDEELEAEKEDASTGGSVGSLEYDFYRDSCPQAENVIREVVRGLYKAQPSVAPALLRLAFHDCFIEGCDASILIDATKDMDSEKDAPPNNGLRGFDVMDVVKSEIEETCPGVVSCADIIVLAAREGVVQAGGPFYPLSTGRKDSTQSFRDIAMYELPSPHSDLSETLADFASRGFDERETVSLLGGHSIGVVHCKFFKDRLYNFGGTNKPDPSIDTAFLHEMMLRCNNKTAEAAPPFHASLPPTSVPLPSFQASPASSSGPLPSFHASPTSSSAPFSSFQASPASPSAPTTSFEGPESSTSPSPSFNSLSSSSSDVPSSAGTPPYKGYTYPTLSSSGAPSSSFQGSLVSAKEGAGMEMAYEGPGVGFGTVYYWSLLQGRGILYSDQQLMVGEETKTWIRAYASNPALFRRDFARAMMKLSNLQVLTGSMGQIRLNCSRVV